MGDLNAKSVAWGSPRTTPRGEALGEWAVEVGLSLLNEGSTNTCVRRQGGSIVDVSFASPVVAEMVRGWRVMRGVETLSDHRYIRFEISPPSAAPEAHRPRREPPLPRWTLKRLNEDALMEASIVKAWLSKETGPEAVQEEDAWFREALADVCDAAMPRTRRGPPPRRQVYWWSPEIEDLRAACVAARRQYTRCRRRRHRDEEMEATLYESYREATGTLQQSIRMAKTRQWEELLGTLDRDPWGRPYLIVRNKLRTWAPPITESLPPRVLEDVVGALFPDRPDDVPRLYRGAPDGEEAPDPGIPQVTREELEAAIKRLRAKNTAPGPDGVPGRVLAKVLSVLGDRFADFLNGLFATGWFPPAWKQARLVLLKKEGRPAESPSAYRPICLLDESGKLFERIIAARLVEHLRTVGPDLADCQFGFREGRSTIDAIGRLKALSEDEIRRGRVLIGTSLDIKNAFNTLPWSVIREALEYHRVPPYLRRIIGAYLGGRFVAYPGRYGKLHRRETHCGVPQGSVLGPLLWNLAYDWVLRGALPPGLWVICYADDTIVLARGDTYSEALIKATAGVTRVVVRIRRLGLEVALQKTEAMWIHGPRQRPPSGSSLRVSGVSVGVRSEMKYLGLLLDSRWSFGNHFDRLAPRIMGAASSLGRLLPNIGGPNDGCRRLYVGVVQSMALYGAPVWHQALMARQRSRALLARAQRSIAIRASRAYRTVSHEAACVLAGSPPWELVAGSYAAAHEWRVGLRQQGVRPTPKAIGTMRLHARRSVFDQWEERLAQPRAGLRTVGAIRPVLREWADRRQAPLTYRMAQVLSGHGCFGEYLCRIRREATTQCHHCEEGDRDTAQHTLEACSAWEVERRALVQVIGQDLSLPTVVSQMVGSREAWNAVSSFCEEVISQKEDAERARESDPDSLPLRQRRGGRRRRAHQRLLL